MVSASDDGTALLWDLRTNKRVMFIQDKATTEGLEIVKAKFLHNANFVATGYGDSLSLFDLRKPAIIVSSASHNYPNLAKNEEEINDFDITLTPTGQTMIATCDDSGQAHVFGVG